MTNQVCPDVRYWPLADMHEWPLRNEARALVEPQFLRQVYGRDGSGDEYSCFGPKADIPPFTRSLHRRFAISAP